MSNDGLLSVDEEGGLKAALPKLARHAEEMGVIGKPLSDWKREEMLSFLTHAVRAAVPLRVNTILNKSLSDAIPFGD